MISNKTRNSLQRAGLTIEQALVMSDNELRRIPDIGRVAVEELREEMVINPRRIVQIATADGVLYALASDGTLWWTRDSGEEWRQEKPLPQPD